MTSQSPIRRHLPLLGLSVLAVAIVVGGLSTRWSRAEQLRRAVDRPSFQPLPASPLRCASLRPLPAVLSALAGCKPASC